MKKKQFFTGIFIVIFTLIAFGLFTLVKAETPSIRINNDEISTYKRRVLLTLSAPAGTEEMRLSENNNFAGADWIPFTRRKYWTTSFGQGMKTVYVQFRGNNGQISSTYSDSIRLSGEPVKVDATLNLGNATTYSLYIPISLTYTPGIESVAIHESREPVESDFIPVQSRIYWALPPGEGLKKIYITFRDNNGNTTTLEKRITYHEPDNAFPAGTLLRGSDGSIYYFGYDSRLHPFPNLLTYHSYYSDFNKVQYVSEATLREYQVGLPVCMRAGTWLVQFGGEAKVYAVEPGCQLRALRSPTEAFLLYGSDWGKRIVKLPTQYKRHYEVVPLSEEEEDADRDGVSRSQEERYGTSDSQEDSDNDELSDYEEIYFWRTNPARRDTDRNGLADGQEIQQLESPTGVGALTEVPANTYIFPSGSIVSFWWGDLKYYYTVGNNVFSFLARSKDHPGFQENNLSPEFALTPPLPIRISITDYPSEEEVKTFREPHIKLYSVLQPL